MAHGFASEGHKSYGSMESGRSIPRVDFGGLQCSPTDMSNLCENITTNIYTINSSGKNLDRALKTVGTESDNQGLRDKVHVTQLSCNQIVSQTTKDLHQLTVLVKKGDKQQKLQVEKLTNDFKDAVQHYSRLQTQIADKMKSQLLTPQPWQSRDFNDDEHEELIQKQEQVAAQQALQRELEFERGLIVEREQRILQIEGDVLDINQIMRELGAMVHEQGDAINSIENNIESVHGNVELGQQELEKAAEYQSKFRKKLCFLAILAIIVGLVLAVILATSLKPR